jgi:winged helix DNA-binding protein
VAIRARSCGLRAADVDAALTAARSHVVSWLNRGTLHLVRAEDHWWLHQLTTPQPATGNARRLAQEGVPPDDAERGVAVIHRSLAADGPLTRAQSGTGSLPRVSARKGRRWFMSSRSRCVA